MFYMKGLRKRTFSRLASSILWMENKMIVDPRDQSEILQRNTLHLTVLLISFHASAVGFQGEL